MHHTNGGPREVPGGELEFVLEKRDKKKPTYLGTIWQQAAVCSTRLSELLKATLLTHLQSRCSMAVIISLLRGTNLLRSMTRVMNV